LKKFKISSMILILAILVLTLSISIHADPDKSINAEYGTPKIDGVVDDIWNQCTGALTSNIYGGGERITDTVSEWKMMWDENKIYFLIQVKDKEINSNNATFWQNDCTQLFIDLVNSNDFDTYDYGGIGEQLGIRFAVPGLIQAPENFLVELLGNGGYLDIEDPLYKAFEKALVVGGEGFIVEYSFDPRLFYKDFKLQAGTQGGVDFINDDSKAGSDIRDILFHWSNNGDTWVSPENLSVFTLAAKKDDPAPVTVPEAAPAPEAASAPETAPVSAPQTSDMGMGVFVLAALVSGGSIIIRIKKPKKN